MAASRRSVNLSLGPMLALTLSLGFSNGRAAMSARTRREIGSVGSRRSAFGMIVLQNSKVPPQQNSRESKLTPSLG